MELSDLEQAVNDMRTTEDEIWKAINEIRLEMQTMQQQIDRFHKTKGEWLSWNAKIYDHAQNLTSRLEELINAMAGEDKTDRRSEDND